ncbi:MAG: PP2C family protein-serine/threonine phosphatase [Phycisphaerales bacterium JB060]
MGRPRTTTIRRSLLGGLLVLVAVTGGAVLLASWVSAQRTVDDASRMLIGPTARRVDAELDRFFGDVRSRVLVARGWGERGLLSATDHRAMNTLFVPILERHPHISSMMVADSDGAEYLLLRDALTPTAWSNRVVQADAMGQEVFFREWDTASGQESERTGQLDYDPRRRIWYRQALEVTEESPVAWSEPVIFFITKDPGITAATSLDLDSPDGPSEMVVAFDLLLLDISRFTSRLPVSENGTAFVLVEQLSGQPGEEATSTMSVVGLPRNERYEDESAMRDALMFTPADSAVVDSQARLPTAGELDEPVLERATRAWEAAGRPDAPVAFRHDGRAWLAGFRRYTLDRNTFWIGVALPKGDLLGGVRLQRLGLLGVVAIILVVGLSRAVFLARRFSRPVEALVAETERIRTGDLEAGEPIRTDVREYRRLAHALREMREGLAARMQLEKVERDLDIARDIQQGLLPDQPPQTPGFTVEGWSQPADQTGGDFFDWMDMPDGRTLIVLADVTGHGIGPALIVAVCRAYMRAAAMGPKMALGAALSRVNDLLQHDIPTGRFVTAAVGVLDAQASELTLLSAGQGPMYFRRADGTVEEWGGDAMPLGIAAGMPFDEARQVRFEPGDTLVLTTDGFFEWANQAGEQFGVERLRAFVTEHGAMPPAEFIEMLHATVKQFGGGTPQPDDLTAVVIQRDPTA